jgi:hypothetical protein
MPQEAYVTRIVETVNDLDNVLYEVSNESGSESVGWQYHMISFIHMGRPFGGEGEPQG